MVVTDGTIRIRDPSITTRRDETISTQPISAPGKPTLTLNALEIASAILSSFLPKFPGSDEWNTIGTNPRLTLSFPSLLTAMSKDNACSSPTVRFDVGGTIYKVSRSLLELFPNTMLSRMVSETWQEVVEDGDENNEASPIFIDRDGERFRYVLDYMRDGRQVSLPATVSRDGFLKDLEYYGFEEVDANSIAERSSLAVYQNTLRRFEELERDIDARIQSDYDVARLAHYCFLRFKHTGTLEFIVDSYCHEPGVFSDRRHQKYNDTKVMAELYNVVYKLSFESNVKKRASFTKCLGEYGLNFTDVSTSKTSNITVSLAIIDGM